MAALWILATVGAVTLARLAVGAVADEVTVRSVDPLTPSAVNEALAAQFTTTTAGEPGATTSTTAAPPPPRSSTTAPKPPASTPATGPSTSTTTTPAVTATSTYTAEGGTITVRFSCGTTVELVSASPNAGFQMDIKNEGPEEVDVEFESDDHESRIRARCADGQPRPEITEDSSDED